MGEECDSDQWCEHGFCVGEDGSKQCECHYCFYNDDGTTSGTKPCSNSYRSRAMAFSLSAGGGILGLDHFYVHGCGCNLGCGKLFTCGGCFIWGLVDVILIISGGYNNAYSYYYTVEK